MGHMLVVMGVSGCGKSSVARAVAEAEGCPLVEGDDFHSPESRDKMTRGIALTDADRAGWLTQLGAEMQKHPEGVVLTCSALKKAYRNRLRESVSGLRFAFLDIDKAEAERRVLARGAAHFFSASLVDNQFATLESPLGEAGVLRLDATAPLKQLQVQLSQWLADPVNT